MNIGFPEIAIFVGVVLFVAAVLWVRSKVNKNSAPTK